MTIILKHSWKTKSVKCFVFFLFVENKKRTNYVEQIIKYVLSRDNRKADCCVPGSVLNEIA